MAQPLKQLSITQEDLLIGPVKRFCNVCKEHRTLMRDFTCCPVCCPPHRCTRAHDQAGKMLAIPNNLSQERRDAGVRVRCKYHGIQHLCKGEKSCPVCCNLRCGGDHWGAGHALVPLDVGDKLDAHLLITQHPPASVIETDQQVSASAVVRGDERDMENGLELALSNVEKKGIKRLNGLIRKLRTDGIKQIGEHKKERGAEENVHTNLELVLKDLEMENDLELVLKIIEKKGKERLNGLIRRLRVDGKEQIEEYQKKRVAAEDLNAVAQHKRRA